MSTLTTQKDTTTEANSSWWATMFIGLGLEAQRRLFGPSITVAEADFLERALELPKGRRLADVPCGNGRLSHEMASRGYRVHWLDYASGLIADARATTKTSASDTSFTQGDMRHLDWHEEFDGCFCLGNSFGYFPHEENLAFLQGVYEALKPGGKFVLQTGILAESILPSLRGRTWYEFGDLLFLHNSRYDFRSEQLHSEYIFVRDGITERKAATYVVYRFNALQQMLIDIGFTIAASYGDLGGKPFEFGSPCLYIVATR